MTYYDILWPCFNTASIVKLWRWSSGTWKPVRCPRPLTAAWLWMVWRIHDDSVDSVSVWAMKTFKAFPFLNKKEEILWIEDHEKILKWFSVIHLISPVHPGQNWIVGPGQHHLTQCLDVDWDNDLVLTGSFESWYVQIWAPKVSLARWWKRGTNLFSSLISHYSLINGIY